MKTTLYNHKSIGTADKPLIPNVVFKALLILIEHKDKDAYEYLLNKYSLHPYQIDLCNYLKSKCINKVNKQGQG